MINRELPTPVSHFSEKQLFKEKILFPNGCILLLTKDCPVLIADKLSQLVQSSGVSWLFPSLCDGETTQARRDVYLPYIADSNGNLPVFKRKEKHPTPKNETLKVEYFTNSLVHEIRTSYLLQEIVSSVSHMLPQTMSFREGQYSVSYNVQQPWGALIDSKNPDSRFGIFKKARGASLRDQVAYAGGWNYLEQYERDFLAQVNKALDVLAKESVKSGLEPWDLGVHQVVSDIDQESRTLSLTILDTEEYNLPEKFGSYWTQALLDIGLPPIILFL